MPMLGDLLATAHRSAGAFMAWLDANDPELMARVGRAAEYGGCSPADFVRAAVAEFSRFASEEHWASLTSRLGSSRDPGTECLLTMLRWRLGAAQSAAPRAREGSTDDGQA